MALLLKLALDHSVQIPARVCDEVIPFGQRVEFLMLDVQIPPVSYTHLDVYKRQISTPTTILTQENLLLPKPTFSPLQGWTPGA